MAKKLTFLFCLIFFMVAILAHNQASSTLLPASQLEPQGNGQMHGTTQGSLQPQECAPRCTGRCSKTSFKKPCMFFCQKCCAKCLCVPPGTYGNKQVCPCYNNWKTKSGGPKCP
ncbi:protein GAST1-like [Olea europaea var. sylvestris]|uniref:Uncharacterized protein n=1 Tax=Olea europaea subsp. europaea TaxID=158383 RepID=A0A8S0SJS7_OLEEU|nr:protein GAST1-like [Olea europaea var. sylvestris]CAA2992223.1 Hypothetical predicted protein [Olea europaea subsp. europaea]